MVLLPLTRHMKKAIDYLITTNLTYLNPGIYKKPYALIADMSKFLASIIDFSNHDISMAKVLTPTEKIHDIVNRYNNRIFDDDN